MRHRPYLFQRGSQPILSWNGGIAPRPIRAADNVALGSLGDLTIIPGGPEPIAGIVSDIQGSMGSFVIGLLIGAVAYHVIKG